MPKLEGRTSHRKTIPLEYAVVGSFVMTTERFAYKKPCCIEGCDHIVSGVFTHNPYQIVFCDGKELKGGGAATIADERDPQLKTVGVACTCHVDQLMELSAQVWEAEQLRQQPEDG